MIDFYTTGDDSEIASYLPDGGAWRCIYSVLIPDIKAGEILQVMAEAEFTNDSGHNCGVWSWIILGTEELAKSGIEITEANGRNILPDLHHDTHVKVGVYQATEDLGDRWVIMLARTQVFGATGKIVKVEKDYGRLTVLRH